MSRNKKTRIVKRELNKQSDVEKYSPLCAKTQQLTSQASTSAFCGPEARKCTFFAFKMCVREEKRNQDIPGTVKTERQKDKRREKKKVPLIEK